MSRIWPDGAKDKYGAEVKENKLKQLAIAEKERRRHLARRDQSSFAACTTDEQHHAR